jgi:LacI family transcriptional regulator
VIRRTVRIVDVAKRANVSPAAVSAVLNNKAGQARLSESVQEAVWAAARELGYRPNIAARSLRSSSAVRDTLYLAVASASETPLTTLGPMFQGVLAFAEQSTTPIQLTLEMFHRGRLHALPGLTNGSRFNGAIIANTAPEDDEYLAHTALPMPVSIFLRRIERHNFVDSDGADCGRQAAELLWNLGRRRFVVVAPAGTTQARTAREQGFRSALRRLGLPDAAVELVVAPSFDEPGGYAAVAEFLDASGQCDAMFAVGDTLALGAMAAIKQRGLSIPGDVAIVGHDDLPMAAFADPPLTTFHIPLTRMAYDAAETLVDLLNGARSAPVHLRYPANLVVRGSAG